ncbi:hypothetical protein EDC56_2562 [Sinobacterium caligoides]|uniref:Uncharacterized protein n=1 Tax=Sinobacterium caligoides TaxID=933926 RepID=A0A3N2DJH7_9GAMM|nr:hypothetical protein [Sinobacterium caligoides]ROR99927.1 hypothetical protein EDC56_2562 [Sinobacterium caligoides]
MDLEAKDVIIPVVSLFTLFIGTWHGRRCHESALRSNEKTHKMALKHNETMQTKAFEEEERKRKENIKIERLEEAYSLVPDIADECRKNTDDELDLIEKAKKGCPEPQGRREKNSNSNKGLRLSMIIASCTNGDTEKKCDEFIEYYLRTIGTEGINWYEGKDSQHLESKKNWIKIHHDEGMYLAGKLSDSISREIKKLMN